MPIPVFLAAIGAGLGKAAATAATVGKAAAAAGAKAGGAIATGAKTLGGKVAASKVGGALATGKNMFRDKLLEGTLTNTSNGLNNPRTTLANSLLGSNSSMPQQAQTQYQFTPSMVDYSQYMGLSPETQRYLYGRW